jgi:hypothetical protein
MELKQNVVDVDCIHIKFEEPRIVPSLCQPYFLVVSLKIMGVGAG